MRKKKIVRIIVVIVCIALVSAFVYAGASLLLQMIEAHLGG